MQQVRRTAVRVRACAGREQALLPGALLRLHQPVSRTAQRALHSAHTPARRAHSGTIHRARGVQHAVIREPELYTPPALTHTPTTG